MLPLPFKREKGAITITLVMVIVVMIAALPWFMKSWNHEITISWFPYIDTIDASIDIVNNGNVTITI